MKHILINWHDATQRILIITFLSQWTIEEMYQARQETWQCLDAVNHPVTVVLDFSNSPLLPHNPLSLIRQTNSMKRHHNEMKPLVAVCPQRFFQDLLQVARRVYPAFFANIIITETLEEALAITTDARRWSAGGGLAVTPGQPVL